MSEEQAWRIEHDSLGEVRVPAEALQGPPGSGGKLSVERSGNRLAQGVHEARQVSRIRSVDTGHPRERDDADRLP